MSRCQYIQGENQLSTLISGFFCGSSSPEITNNLIDVTVKEGKEASFTCSVKNLGGYRV